MSKQPVTVFIKKGERYSWCRCVKSQTLPKCDGSHKGSEIIPVRILAKSDITVQVCGCQQTANPPYCDGTHQIKFGGAREDYYHLDE